MQEFTESTGEQWQVFVSDTFASQMKVAMHEMGITLISRMQDTFDSKGARGGHEEWLITYNPTPLIQSGALRGSFDEDVEEEGEDFILFVGTDKEYARKHNEGLGFPEREFMFYTDDDFEMIGETLRDYVGAPE